MFALLNPVPIIRRLIDRASIPNNGQCSGSNDVFNNQPTPTVGLTPAENVSPGHTISDSQGESVNSSSLEPSHLRPSTDPTNGNRVRGMEYRDNQLHLQPVCNDGGFCLENELARLLLRVAFLPIFQPLIHGTRCTWRNVQQAVNSSLNDILFDLSSYLVSHKLLNYNTFRHRPLNSWMHYFLSEIKYKGYGSWNLGVFSPDDINPALVSILPRSITDTLLPINVEDGPLNFYNSFCMAYLACRDGGDVFRRAVAHRAISYPYEFNEISDLLGEEKHRVLSNLKYAGPPTKTELALLSKLVEKNITVFTFDEAGNLISDVYFNFSPLHSVGTKTVYLGCYASGNGVKYFPLIRKVNREGNPPEAKSSAIRSASTGFFGFHD